MIKNHMYGAMGIGLIPLPVVDFLALTGIQIRLLYKLSKFYGVDFSKDKAKNIISALIGSFVPVATAGPIASMIKIVPIIGQVTSALTMLVTGGACTYALGNVFVQHFSLGVPFLISIPRRSRSILPSNTKKDRNSPLKRRLHKKLILQISMAASSMYFGIFWQP